MRFRGGDIVCNCGGGATPCPKFYLSVTVTCAIGAPITRYTLVTTITLNNRHWIIIPIILFALAKIQN